MALLSNLCSLFIVLMVMLGHTTASGQRNLAPPIYAPQRSQVTHRISPVLRSPRRTSRQNQPLSYHTQAAQFYRPNYQPPSGGNTYFDPSYEPSNYRESYNNPSAGYNNPSAVYNNPSMTLATYNNPAAAFSNPSPSFKVPAGFDASQFEPSHEPSSYKPTAVKSSQTGDHDNSESRLERQSGGGGGHDSFVDFGAHSGHKGSFGWYADFPVHKDT